MFILADQLKNKNLKINRRNSFSLLSDNSLELNKYINCIINTKGIIPDTLKTFYAAYDQKVLKKFHFKKKFTKFRY